MVVMMMALGFRVPLSVKEYTVFRPDEFTTSDCHITAFHSTTTLLSANRRERGSQREKGINTQTQLDFPDLLLLPLYY